MTRDSSAGSGAGATTLDSTSGASTQVHVDEAYCSACNQSFPSETKICPNDGARLIKLAAERDDLIGKVLDERYEIRAPLGKGGMGTVYRGWQLSVDREVAIKVIHPKLAGDRSAVKRFLREARLASRLSQPNIVNVYDFGQSDGVLYLVMELLRGHTLSSELGNGRRMNPKRTVTIALQLCDALEAAHAQGIIHRDLKPSNIVILDDPPGRDLIKVLDFGLAKSLLADSGSVVTNTDALLGTPLYMAPEQIDGKVSDQRADLYSFGCILYEMLSGKPPFVDSSVSAVLARHIGDTPAPLPPHVPARLRALIEGLLAKSPEERVQTAGEARRVLDDIRDAPGLATPPQPFATIDAPADTIPEIHEAFAETAAQTPTPAGMVRSRVAPPAPSVVTSPAAGSRVRRVAVLGAGAVVAATIAGAVAFRGGTSSKQHREAGSAVAPVGTPVTGGQGAASGSAPAPEVPVVTPPVDAGVATVTVEPVPVPAAVDAGVKAAGKKRRAPADAGASGGLPDLDFVPSGK